MAEEEGEDGHGQEGLENDPGDADEGLLVANFDVAPDEEKEEFAIVPEFARAELQPAALRGDMEERRGRSGVFKRRGAGAEESHATNSSPDGMTLTILAERKGARTGSYGREARKACPR